VPHPTTLMKLTTRCGDGAVAGLNEALLAKAARAKLLRASRCARTPPWCPRKWPMPVPPRPGPRTSSLPGSCPVPGKRCGRRRVPSPLHGDLDGALPLRFRKEPVHAAGYLQPELQAHLIRDQPGTQRPGDFLLRPPRPPRPPAAARSTCRPGRAARDSGSRGCRSLGPCRDPVEENVDAGEKLVPVVVIAKL